MSSADGSIASSSVGGEGVSIPGPGPGSRQRDGHGARDDRGQRGQLARRLLHLPRQQHLPPARGLAPGRHLSRGSAPGGLPVKHPARELRRGPVAVPERDPVHPRPLRSAAREHGIVATPESDPSPYPFPLNAPVEGRPDCPVAADQHVLVLQTAGEANHAGSGRYFKGPPTATAPGTPRTEPTGTSAATTCGRSAGRRRTRRAYR